MADTPNLADTLYKEITAVIGGDNPNQYFCMGLPGTLIDPAQYTYDVDHNEPKPAHVKANESKLANKLFDACFMTSSDNGRHLQTQYKTALNMLTPKLNSKLFEAKSRLREMLMTPYPYNFGDGSDDVLTLEQVFYKLYREYVSAKRKWTEMQINKKQELANKYPQNTEEDYIKRNDEFLEWYGIVAESEELTVEEKLGEVLSVFSPGDMEIITGILESGVGRELQEARSALANVGELNPDGGYVYPVTFYPQDWFKLLETSFTEIDLLESPAALAQRLKVLKMQQSNITANINQFLRIVPDNEKVEALKKNYDACEDTYKKAFSDYVGNNTNVTLDMFKTALDVIAANGSENKDDKVDAVNKVTISALLGSAAEKIDIGKLKTVATGCLNAQNALINSSGEAVNAAMEYFKNKNMQQMSSMIEPLQQQLQDVNEEIEELKQKIALSNVMKSAEDSEKEPPAESAVAPNKVPERFTQIIINSSMESLQQQSSMESNASQSSYGVSFFFGGYSSNKSHQDSVSQTMQNSSSMEIQIGMSVAKVQIEREWFNPGVFMLTADMYNTSSERISPADDSIGFNSDNEEAVKKRLNDMNKTVFSCYPTSFVIAKDVTIKFVTKEAMSSSFAKSVEDHSSKGGGFFIFGGSSSQSSSSSESSSSASSNAHSVTVRFTAPQIVGYYMEAVPADKSTSITSAQSSDTSFVSIFEFIDAFQEMLNDYNKKYHGEMVSEQAEQTAQTVQTGQAGQNEQAAK